MRFIEGELYHVYNRGNNKRQIFFNEENYIFFLKKIRKWIAPNCDILCWCLMPNHFHLLLRANGSSIIELPSYGGKPIQHLALNIGRTLSSYSSAINKQEGTSGSLFQQKTKAKLLSEIKKQTTSITLEQYTINSMHYIHQNPLRAGFVKRLEDWKYSSFRDYAGLRNGTLCKKDTLLGITGYKLSTFYADSYVLIS